MIQSESCSASGVHGLLLADRRCSVEVVAGRVLCFAEVWQGRPPRVLYVFSSPDITSRHAVLVTDVPARLLKAWRAGRGECCHGADDPAEPRPNHLRFALYVLYIVPLVEYSVLLYNDYQGFCQ